MSTGASGYPDWQRPTQWFGAPIEQATGLLIGAGSHTSGPFDVRSFASIVVCVKPTGGNCNVTVKQTVPAGPGSLVVSSTFIVNAGNVIFESFVLLAGQVEIDFAGTAGGETIDYAIVPSNANTNAEVAALTQLGFQHNDAVIATENALDLEDSSTLAWAFVDDTVNLRMKVTPTALIPAGTSFPAGPVDGQFYSYAADTATGVFWLFRWYAAGGYWAFVGGPPLYSEVATAEATASLAYADLATVGPAIALPFAADYLVTHGCLALGSGAGGGGAMSYAIGGTAASDLDGIQSDSAIGDAISRTRRKAGLGAVTLTAKYLAFTGAGATFVRRWVKVLPVKK